MDWQEKIDLCYVLNLPNRVDRRATIGDHLTHHKIEFEFYDAIPDEIGWKGLIKTIRRLFIEIYQGTTYNNVLVFEDDAKFLYDPHGVMNKCMNDLPQNYMMLQLGYNLLAPVARVADNIISIRSSYSTHAILYSREAMAEILSATALEDEPYDIALMKKLQVMGRCFGVYPRLCTQRAGYSDIEKKDIDWGKLMDITCRQYTKHLI